MLRIVDEKLNSELNSCCKRDDDYIAPGKPSCDWDDVAAREALVDALARDAYAILAALDGRTLASEVTQAAKLVATVVGQDLERPGVQRSSIDSMSARPRAEAQARGPRRLHARTRVPSVFDLSPA